MKNGIDESTTFSDYLLPTYPREFIFLNFQEKNAGFSAFSRGIPGVLNFFSIKPFNRRSRP
jgi:hypothetical protein